MKKKFHIVIASAAVALLLSCVGRGEGGASAGVSDDAYFDSLLVINELMANNRTGLCDESGEPADWVEIKCEARSVKCEDMEEDLKGFSLAVTKPNGKEKLFPLGENVRKCNEDLCVVFLKLPKEGKVQLLAPNGAVVSEVEYPEMSADESYCRREDRTYEKTRWQSPGFENDADGYEAYCRQMDEGRQGQLLIWEVFSRAEKRKDCWVELKNVSNDTVALTGYGLGKEVKKVNGLTVGDERLAPGKIIVVPFKIGDLETVVLTKDGKFVDGVCAKPTYFGKSIGRVIDRKGFFFFASQTRGKENTAYPYRYIAEKPEITRLAVNGSSPKSTHGQFAVSVEGIARVHYTLDGSEPNDGSPVWPLMVDNGQQTTDNGQHQVRLEPLVMNGNTTIRAYTEGDSLTLRSDVTTQTFLVDAPHTVPVVNITIDEADMYDYNRGIYADGPGYTVQWPHKGANYWKSWTKKAHVEFLTDNGQQTTDNGQRSMINTDCGFKIFGGYSRYEAKKSFTVKFKNCYGASKIEYDYFGTGEPVELNDMVLRSGSQDWNRCMVRDEFFTSLMAPHCPTLLIQAYRPVALYINGDYFGLYYIREKIDRHFVARKLGVSEDSITIIASSQYLEEGTKTEYNNLMNYIRSHNMAEQECYDYVKARVDLQGLIDFKLGEIYSGNTDVGNVRQVRSADADCDGKWYFVFYDLDASWVGYKPTASYYLRCGSDAQQGGLHNRMINSLLNNHEFRQLFMERLSLHMHKTFSTKNATTVFDELVNTIRPEMERNCERWPQLSYKQWEKNIQDFRARFVDKHKVMLNDLRQLLSITPEEEKKFFSDLGF